MAEPQASFRELELKDAGSKAFATAEDLRDWLKAESDFWSWAMKNNPTDLGLTDDKRNQFVGWVRKAHDALASFVTNRDDEVLKAAEKHLVWYAGTGLASATSRAKFIEGLRSSEQGEVVAQAALAEYLGSARDPEPARQDQKYRYPSARGRMAIAIFDTGIGPDSVAAISVSTKQMSDEFKRTLKKQALAYREKLDELVAKTGQVETKGEEAERARSAQLTAELSRMLTEKDKALKEIEHTRATYVEFMHLGAAVDYWQKKGTLHAVNAKWWLARLSWYSIIAFVLLLIVFAGAFWSARYVAVNASDAFNRVFILETAGLAAFVTVLFWVARFLSRLFLSERHMAIDAQHRAVMAEAYLALSNEGKVEASDRALVLQPLFRSGGDGIIKDDGGFESVLALVARTLERPLPSKPS